jgi:hypothetical protein
MIADWPRYGSYVAWVHRSIGMRRASLSLIVIEAPNTSKGSIKRRVFAHFLGSLSVTVAERHSQFGVRGSNLF